ncbi:MAG: hypothetical protein NVSMB43_26330 [Pseudarthrobacter sp.]
MFALGNVGGIAYSSETVRASEHWLALGGLQDFRNLESMSEPTACAHTVFAEFDRAVSPAAEAVMTGVEDRP